jgi:hypothetical protein
VGLKALWAETGMAAEPVGVAAPAAGIVASDTTPAHAVHAERATSRRPDKYRRSFMAFTMNGDVSPCDGKASPQPRVADRLLKTTITPTPPIFHQPV